MRAFLTAAVLATVVWGTAATAAVEPSVVVDPAVAATQTALEQAWNTGDGLAWGQAFWPDADSVNVYGGMMHGGEAQGARHAEVFAGRMKGSHIKVTIQKVKVLSPDLLLLETNQSLMIPGDAAMRNVHVSAIVERRQGLWKIAYVHNTNVTTTPPA